MNGPAARLRVSITGVVQGLGFRPFVLRLARALGLSGWVANTAGGVTVEVQGGQPDLQEFLRRLEAEKPALAFFQTLETEEVPAGPGAPEGFVIRESRAGGEPSAFVLPDIATCPQCLKELFDPRDRRHRYPFINCTHCGPRYSILEHLPYDRPQTSMRIFTMCPACRAEYEDPADRRFHAQPNACPECGPHLELWDPSGSVLAAREEALTAAVQAVREGRIVAVKGLGGFHLVVDATQERAVERLRARKHRYAKPLAVMVPDRAAANAYARVKPPHARLLLSAQAPIVLMEKQPRVGRYPLLAPSVAPDNPYLGVMLPYTPLHHLLMDRLKVPVVATSGNLSEEPICTDEREALERLGGIADLFLVHNRPVVRHVDDSVACCPQDGEPMLLRRARGYAPLPVVAGRDMEPLLALGGHLKNTVAFGLRDRLFVSQHIGDLASLPSVRAFERTIEGLREIYPQAPARVAHDLHPEYVSSKMAARFGVPAVAVQHHHAHVAACMAEHGLEDEVLGIAWDGTGFGTDGTIWGGEFLLCGYGGFERAAHFRTFPLPGGDAAVVEPRRSALGILFTMDADVQGTFGDLPALRAFALEEKRVITEMLRRGVNSPLTSSAGRLFDAAAALTGLCQKADFEAQAAAALEYRLPPAGGEERYPYAVTDGPPGGAKWIVDWEPMFRTMIEDVRRSLPPGEVSLRFHNTLIEAAVDIAGRCGRKTVVVSGGCFQNMYLLNRMVRRLGEAGFAVFRPRWVPPNDGGIAVGQAAVAARSGASRRSAPESRGPRVPEKTKDL